MATGKENEIVTIFRTMGMDQPEKAYKVMLQLVEAYIVANGKASLTAKNLSSVIMNVAGSSEKLRNEIAGIVAQFDKLSRVSKNIRPLQALGFGDLKDVRSTRAYITKGLEEVATPKAMPIRAANLAKQAEIATANFEKNTRPIPVEIQPFVNVDEMHQSFTAIKKQLAAIPDDTKRVRTAQEVIQKVNQEYQANLKNAKTLKEKIDLAIAYKSEIKGIEVASTLDRKTGKRTGADTAYVSQFETLTGSTKKQTSAFIEKTKAEQASATAQSDLVAQQTKTDASIQTAIGKLIRYRVAFFAMRGAIQAVQTALKDFIDLQSQLIGLEIVMDRQTDSIVRYRKEAFAMAQTFGVAIKDVVDVFHVWAQTGLKQNEVLEATKATLIGVNAVGGTAQEVVSSLTAAMYTYGYSVEELTTVVSKWLAVQKDFPVDAKDLAESLRIVGAAGKIVGVELDELLGLITAVNALTRKSGTEIANSMKTIFARIPRTAVIQQFEAIGIPVLAAADEFRSFTDVLTDLDKQWDKLSSTQKAAIAIETSGIRRYSDFIALMDNWDIAMKAIIISQKSSNESLDANAMVLSSMKKHWESAKIAVDKFGISIGQVLMGPLGGLIETLNKLMGVINSLGAISRIFAGFIAGVSVFVGLKIAVTAATFAFDWIKKSILSYTVAMSAATKVTAGFEGVVKKVNLATKIGGWMNVIILAASAFSLLWSAIGSGAAIASESVEDFSNSLDASYKSSKQRIEALEQEKILYGSLPNKINEARKALSGMEKGTKQYNEQTKKIHALLQILPKDYAPINTAVSEYQDNLDSTKDSIVGVKNATDSYLGTMDAQIAAAKKLNAELRTNLVRTRTDERNTLKAKEDALKRIQESISIKGINNYTLFPGLNPSTITDRIVSQIKQGFNTIPTAFLVTSDLKSSISNFAKEINKTFKEDFGEDTPDIINITELENNLDRVQSGLMAWMKGYYTNNKITDKLVGETFDPIKLFAHLRDSKNTEILTSFVNDFTSEMQRLVSNSNINLSSLVTTQMGIVGGQKGDLDQFLRLLDEKPTEQGEGFLLGKFFGKDATGSIDKMKEVLNDYARIEEQISSVKRDTKYGQVFSIDETKLDLAVDYLKRFSGAANDAKDNLAKIREKQNFVNQAWKEMQGYSTLTPDKITNEITARLNALIKKFPELSDFMSTAAGQQDTVNAIMALDNKKKELDASATAIEAMLGSPILANIHKELESIIAQSNKFRKTMDSIALSIRSTYEPGLARIDMQLGVLSGLEGKEKEILALQKQKIELQYKYDQAIASITVPATDRVLKKEEAILQKTEAMTKLISEEGQARIKKLLDLYTAAANEMRNVLRDSLSGAFQNIPTNILGNADKRRELANDLRSSEFELQEARREGDKNAIAQAQYRVDLVKYEMKEYKRGWAEVKAAILDVFGSISGAYWKQMSEKLAQSISDISFKNTTIGDVIGNAILSSTNQFLSDWVITTERIFGKIISEINRLDSERDKRLAELKGLAGPQVGTVALSQKPQFNIGSKNQPQFANPTNLQEVYDPKTKEAIDKLTESNKEVTTETSQVIKGSLMMLMSTLAIGITGTKNQGANVGATFGSMAGSALVNDQIKNGFLKNAGGIVGMLGGPVGSLLGGIAGGLLGGLFGGGKPPEEPLQRALVDNTEATIQNTIAMKELDKAIFNAPTRFNVPTFSGGFGASPINITVNATGNAKEIAQQVRQVFNDTYRNESRIYGTRGYRVV